MSVHERMRLPKLVTAGIAALAVAACDQRSIPTVAGIGGTSTTSGSTGKNTGAGIPLALTPSQLAVAVGATFPLTTNAPPALQNQIEWRTAQPNIATVNGAGVVTGIAPGTAVVSARYTFDTTQTASAIVSVTGAGGL